MRKLDIASPFASLACIVAFLLGGVFAIGGSPFREAPPAFDMERPAWLDRMVGNGTFPAYYVGLDAASVPIGRAVLGEGRVSLALFADKWEDLSARGGTAVKVHVLPTDVKALWATVPKESKLRIADRSERLARHLQSKLVAIVGSPNFARRYQDVFRTIGADAYDAIWVDPRFRLIESAMEGLYRPEDGERLAAVLMPIVLPELRRAVLEILTPGWQDVRDLMLEGRIDPKPFRDAAGRIVLNPELQSAVADAITRTASNPRVWRVAALIADIYIEKVTSDPRFERLASDLMRDPLFESDMRSIEVAVTDFTTTVFNLIVQRGTDDIPDTLAMRMLRYILLNRISAVAILVDESDPQAAAIERYAVTRRQP